MPDHTTWTSRTVAVPGAVPGVRIFERGDPEAPTVLLLHGWPQHAALWRRLDPTVFGDRHVVAVDLPGFGGTDPLPGSFSFATAASVVERLLDALDIRQCDIVAHDVGAWLAFHLDPRRVTGLLAIGVPPPWMARRDLFRALPRFAYQLPLIIPGIGPALIRRGGIVGRYLQRGAWRARTWSGVEHVAYASYVRQFADRRRARASSRLYTTLLVREILGRLLWHRGGGGPGRWAGKDVGLLLAANDPVFGASFFRHTPSMAFEVIPECGHFVVDEQPALAGAAIGHFLGPTATAAMGTALAPAGRWATGLRAAVQRESPAFDSRLRTDVLPGRRRRDRATEGRRQEVAVYLAQPGGASSTP